MVVMQGAVHAEYPAGNTVVGPPGLATVSPGEAAHFNKTRLPMPPTDCPNANCVPSRESTGEVRIWPPVLYAQYTEGKATSEVIALSLRVTAPLRAIALPVSESPAASEIEVNARMVPDTEEVPLRTAELFTTQSTLPAVAPLVSRMAPETLSPLPIWKM